MTLTEQWKKGELPSGWYYTKLWKGCNVIDKFIGNQFLRYNDSDIVEVLAPVPSYEEWQRLKEFADYSLYNRNELTRQINFWMDKYTQLEKENQQLKESHKRLKDTQNLELEVRRENQQLKELLKECRDYIGDGCLSLQECRNVINKIDNAMEKRSE